MAKHLKPNQVVESYLFKRVAPCIESITNAQLVYELVKASQHTDVYLRGRDLDDALTWCGSPQGERFWEELNDEHHGHPNYED